MKERKPGDVHLYGSLARGGVVLTACGRARFQLPSRDIMVMHRDLSRVTCPKCLEEMKP